MKLWVLFLAFGVIQVPRRRSLDSRSRNGLSCGDPKRPHCIQVAHSCWSVCPVCGRSFFPSVPHRVMNDKQACRMVTIQLYHDLATYKTLPLNCYEKATIINTVLIPRWNHRGVFLGSRPCVAKWDDILLQYVYDTPGIVALMNRHRVVGGVCQVVSQVGQYRWLDPVLPTLRGVRVVDNICLPGHRRTFFSIPSLA